MTPADAARLAERLQEDHPECDIRLVRRRDDTTGLEAVWDGGSVTGAPAEVEAVLVRAS